MKPPLKNYPPIWAQSRQEICESLDWFRSYQGGVYQTNGSAKGYFLSGFSAKRDIFACDGKIIVSHGGGKAESITRVKGKVTVTPAEDQRETDKSVKALLETYKTGQPLVLLIDDKYVPFPFDLLALVLRMGGTFTYPVLGFYKIVHAWTEYEKAGTAGTRVVRYKFAFQWMEGQGEPWWLKEDSDGMLHSSSRLDSSLGMYTIFRYLSRSSQRSSSPLRPAHLYFTCSMCGQQSAHVYQQAWTCLHSKCPAFWTTSSGNQLPEQLDYNPQFLAIIDLRPLPASFQSALSLPPPVFAPISGIASTAKLTKGWHCEKCGRLSCRSAWEEYRCPHCGGADSLVEDGSGEWLFPLDCKTNQLIHIQASWNANRYSLTVQVHKGDVRHSSYRNRGKGFIHLIKMPRTANIEVDNIFVAYQEQAAEGILRFRRWPLRMRGSLLTNYFSQNSGEAYQYVGGAANTVPFEDAPSAVVQAHNVIEKRISDALQEEHRFNEVLSAGYMEEQSMAFHSDAERGLGPLVAGLSMGSPALMHFRLRAKHSPGRPKGAKATAMTVVLRHGDICVMEGHGVQDFYEHTVVPSNFRIAATARWISSEHPQPHVKKLST
ncbi:hypothetical protein C8R43DRAFT_874003 [Mycena crocata]|nr:hypothetical protein C8R43DRAFT_874003 [Mycena crocata]